ncbi:MAG: rubredoxin [Thermoplasmata archaeon]
MKVLYQCQVCGYIYDPDEGDETQGIPPGTTFENLPESWVCPVCGASKDMFSAVVS